jgi:hypothetical protein
MKGRCNNPNDAKFPDYGGRGIYVCPEWEYDFARFLSDMGPRPQGKSLDRKDNDGNYGPDNCRWATPQEQQRNKQDSVWVEYCEERMTLKTLSEKLALNYKRLHWLYRSRRMSLEDAIRCVTSGSL